MPTQDYRQQIAEYVRANALPPDKYSHQPRLYQLAGLLGEGRDYDDDVLYAAAWLHDLGVFTGHRPDDPAALDSWDNVAYAVRAVPPLLERFGFPAEKISRVADAIQTHLPSGRPKAIEGVLLRDADILEQLGGIGIARMLSKVGRDTRYRTHGDAINALKRSARDLPGQLSTDTARQLAADRLAAMDAFFKAVRNEAGNLGL